MMIQNPYGENTRSKMMKRTWYFEVYANPPIRVSLRTINIQITQSDFLHAFFDLASAFIPSNSDFITTV